MATIVVTGDTAAAAKRRRRNRKKVSSRHLTRVNTTQIRYERHLPVVSADLTLASRMRYSTTTPGNSCELSPFTPSPPNPNHSLLSFKRHFPCSRALTSVRCPTPLFHLPSFSIHPPAFHDNTSAKVTRRFD